jgi:uncharacterized Zn-finger protein
MSSDMTVGDDQEIECPTCSKNICLIDWRIDGTLEAGQTDQCPHCGGKFVIAAVDWDPTVWIKSECR